MKRVVVRDKRTGRFTKAWRAKAGQSVVKEEIEAVEHEVVVARGKRGRFVKKATARRHPDKTSLEVVKR